VLKTGSENMRVMRRDPTIEAAIRTAISINPTFQNLLTKNIVATVKR